MCGITRSLTISGPLIRAAALALLPLLAQRGSAADAEDVYKCVDGSNVTYRSSPNSPNCRRIDLQVSEPSAEELARLAKEQQQRERDAQLADQQAQQERLVRAKELEAAAALRRAQAEEAQARLLREQQQRTTFPYTYYSYPYWGYEAWPPRYHPYPRRHDFEKPSGPMPPSPEQAPDAGSRPRPGFNIRIR
jgi:hypothetical protein